MMNDRSIPLEAFMMKYFVKYNRLDQIIPYAFANSRATSIDLFIDLYGIYRGIFSRNYVTQITDYTSFTSTLINMCCHYRTYFKLLGVTSKIFIISSFNIPDNASKFVAGYNTTFKDKLKNKFISDMVDQNIQLLEILCPYLPDIHLVKSDFESSVAMYAIINKEKSLGRIVPNLIISSDMYPVQLTTLVNDTVLIQPKKSKGEDDSLIICPKSHPEHEISFWSRICQEKEDFTLNQSVVSVTSTNYVLLAALNRFPDRNLKAIVNFTKANKIIESILHNSDVKINPELLFEISNPLLEGVPLQLVQSRYKALDVEYQYILYNESVEPMLLEFNNLSDPDAIQLINDKYFSNNPIDLYRL